mmetsp:Transcript_16035/g.39402  ORF Transcript_16035/g.39402 Transcript_16035/m.39402 type:complete len:277 (-) Transcript_16035:966-1796(-)
MIPHVEATLDEDLVPVRNGGGTPARCEGARDGAGRVHVLPRHCHGGHEAGGVCDGDKVDIERVRGIAACPLAPRDVKRLCQRIDGRHRRGEVQRVEVGVGRHGVFLVISGIEDGHRYGCSSYPISQRSAHADDISVSDRDHRAAVPPLLHGGGRRRVVASRLIAKSLPLERATLDHLRLHCELKALAGSVSVGRVTFPHAGGARAKDVEHVPPGGANFCLVVEARNVAVAGVAFPERAKANTFVAAQGTGPETRPGERGAGCAREFRLFLKQHLRL